jgi:hypothetical protein
VHAWARGEAGQGRGKGRLRERPDVRALVMPS